MEFLNPNVSGDMAQLLQHNQEKYVPCIKLKDGQKELVATIPLHGDQLFEERARNAIWTFRDGENPYERLEGIDTEFADWHAKYTLYKVIKILYLHRGQAKQTTIFVIPFPKFHMHNYLHSFPILSWFEGQRATWECDWGFLHNSNHWQTDDLQLHNK